MAILISIAWKFGGKEVVVIANETSVKCSGKV